MWRLGKSFRYPGDAILLHRLWRSVVREDNKIIIINLNCESPRPTSIEPASKEEILAAIIKFHNNKAPAWCNGVDQWTHQAGKTSISVTPLKKGDGIFHSDTETKAEVLNDQFYLVYTNSKENLTSLPNKWPIPHPTMPRIAFSLQESTNYSTTKECTNPQDQMRFKQDSCMNFQTI